MAVFVLVPVLGACAVPPDEEGTGENSAEVVEEGLEVDDETKAETAVASTDARGGSCFCTGEFACGHSSSARYMHSKARRALAAAGVPESALIQTFGDAQASVGTHCPEPGTTYSAATDMAQGSNPCGRVSRLRLEGFAAWYRTAPEFPGNRHIHAVYAGTPRLKDSLKRQVSSFLQGRNGLRSNAIDRHCPITEREKAAVRAAQNDNGPDERCVVGGHYCGGDKLEGDPDTLYRYKSDGTGSVIRRCPNGCRWNAGRDDTCK